MLKILVTYAVQGEFVEIKWPDVDRIMCAQALEK